MGTEIHALSVDSEVVDQVQAILDRLRTGAFSEVGLLDEAQAAQVSITMMFQAITLACMREAATDEQRNAIVRGFGLAFGAIVICMVMQVPPERRVPGVMNISEVIYSAMGDAILTAFDKGMLTP